MNMYNVIVALKINMSVNIITKYLLLKLETNKMEKLFIEIQKFIQRGKITAFLL